MSAQGLHTGWLKCPLYIRPACPRQGARVNKLRKADLPEQPLCCRNLLLFYQYFLLEIIFDKKYYTQYFFRIVNKIYLFLYTFKNFEQNKILFEMEKKITKSALLVGILVLVFSCSDNIEVNEPQLINYKGLQVNHTYDVPKSIITDNDFDAIIDQRTNIYLTDTEGRNTTLGEVVYSLDDLGLIAEEEELNVPNENWTDTQVLNQIYLNFPTISTLQEIQLNWNIIASYYTDIVQYNVTDRLDEVSTYILSPTQLENNGGNNETDGIVSPRSSSYGSDFSGNLSSCEFWYLASRWAMANAARKAGPEAVSEAKARWIGSGVNDRQDVLRHLAGSFLLAHYYAKGFFQNDINNIYDKCWDFLAFREEQACSDAPDHVREMDHRSNLNGLGAWKVWAYYEWKFFNLRKRVRSEDKSTAMAFFSDVKTLWSEKVAENSQAVWNVDNWICVYFAD